MRHIPGTKYMLVLEYGSGWPVRREQFGPIVETWDDAMSLCATASREAQGFTRYLILHATAEPMLQQVYDQLKRGGSLTSSYVTPEVAEVERRKLEDGEGGDHDVTFVFEMPAWAPTEMKWVELLAKVERGELGGEHDASHEAGQIIE